MITFEYIKDLIKDKELPLAGVNEDGENVIVEWSAQYGAYRVTTIQHNDWLRINHYYKDGTIEETYSK